MESVVFEDSPLALYLEGDGEAKDNGWTPDSTINVQPTPLSQISSFAPQGLPAQPRERRPKPPRLLKLERLPSKGAVARLHHACSSALNSRLGWAEKGRFLEQFRYTIIASQLLNDVPNPGIYKRQDSLQSAGNGLLGPDQDGQKLAFSWIGISVTASAAFAWVWSIHWTRKVATSTSRMWPLLLVPTVAIMICSVLYLYCRRQWLHWVRSQAVESASTLVAGAQNLDAAVSASINLIQEVELISHGYRMQEEPVPPFFPALLTGSRSSPLPPVTRIEEKSQLRRCTRLRSALQRALSSLPAAYYRAFEEMKALAVQADLEKYYNIYEISRTEMLEMEGVKDTFMSDFGQETLKSFKYGSQKLHLARKLFFCSLLALSADGGKVDFARWSTATRLMDSLSVETSRATQDVDETLGAEEELPTPASPQMPLTPGRERIRKQMQKLTSLSQGLRGIQASVHLLREDADKLAGNSSQGSTTMASCYTSIGTELKDLLEEWQEGQAIFKSSIDTSNNRLSLPVVPRTTPSSPTMSLGGATAVEGSPPDAHRALNGYGSCYQSSSSTATSSAGEEVFEAIALPQQKSILSREERIAKMKEDRVRQAVAKSKAEATTHMLKELETVIKLRPRGRTTGRIPTP